MDDFNIHVDIDGLGTQCTLSHYQIRLASVSAYINKPTLCFNHALDPVLVYGIDIEKKKLREKGIMYL